MTYHNPEAYLMLQLLMAVLMFVGAYVTHTGKFTMFYSYYNPRMDQSKIDEIEAKRKKKATVLLLVMGVLSILSAVLSFASVVFCSMTACIIIMAVRRPSPVVAYFRKITWPDCSPPREYRFSFIRA